MVWSQNGSLCDKFEQAADHRKGCVKGSKLVEFVEHGLSGGFVQNRGTNIVLFKEVAKTGKITSTRWLLSVWGRQRAKVVLMGPRWWRLGWNEFKEVARAEM